MRFSSIVMTSSLVFTAGCLSTTTDVRHFGCEMTDRVLEDKTAQSEWVEKFLPSKFNLAVENPRRAKVNVSILSACLDLKLSL